jgi:Na+-translocating ferredoxin:NAD+ oxidoreductase subunit G
MNVHPVLISGAFLAAFAVIGTSFVAFTESQTRITIIENEKAVLLRNLNALLPPNQYDNAITEDIQLLAPSTLLGTNTEAPVYRARLSGEPTAVILNTIAPDGYNGEIHLLVGIYLNGTVAGVRIVKHAETPGLGDAIEIRKSKWVLSFDQRSLNNPSIENWQVDRDGGYFDAMTGATITPRAVVKAVKNTLIYFKQNKSKLFDGPTNE